MIALCGIEVFGREGALGCLGALELPRRKYPREK